jgi:hypothetical protein
MVNITEDRLRDLQPVDFFAGRFSHLDGDAGRLDTPDDFYEAPIKKAKRNVAGPVGMAILAAAVLVGGAKAATTDTARQMFVDATSFMNRDKSVTHGADNPEVAKQRKQIASLHGAEVLAFSLAENPGSTSEMACEPYEVKPNDSPWGVAEHYARIYQLGEKPVRQLVTDIADVVGAQMQPGERFAVCVRNSN